MDSGRTLGAAFPDGGFFAGRISTMIGKRANGLTAAVVVFDLRFRAARGSGRRPPVPCAPLLERLERAGPTAGTGAGTPMFGLVVVVGGAFALVVCIAAPGLVRTTRAAIARSWWSCRRPGAGFMGRVGES